MEDDWVINFNYKTFDSDLINIFKNNLTGGFLNLWSPENFNCLEFHSAISVGIVDNNTKNFIKNKFPFL